ncbi:MAG: thiamine pyrophosphate-dependent enzyme [Brevinematia bacterium]
MELKLLFDKPKTMSDNKTHYCPGCGHGVLHRLIAEVIDELNIRDRVVGIAPVGCAVTAYDYWNIDMSEAAHGRVGAVATGIKRARPDLIVFGYQGDGDLAAIGLAETLHAANRGENITIIFVNNATYGMTGGQTAPTTLPNQVTRTSPNGREPSKEGYPMKISEMIALFEAPVYVERTMVTSFETINKTKQAIKRAFQLQLENKGYSFVEVLSGCPNEWHLTPVEANKWIENEMTKYYPLGVFKDKYGLVKRI